MAPKGKSKDMPDLEEAIEEEDDGDVVEAAEVEEDELDLTKDKYIKQPRAKKATTKKAAKAVVDDEDEDDVKAKPKAKGRGRPKKN